MKDYNFLIPDSRERGFDFTPSSSLLAQKITGKSVRSAQSARFGARAVG